MSKLSAPPPAFNRAKHLNRFLFYISRDFFLFFAKPALQKKYSVKITRDTGSHKLTHLTLSILFPGDKKKLT